MYIDPEEARALMLRADPGHVWGDWPVGLRDSAVLALLAAGLSAAEISHLKASAITMGRGNLLVRLKRRGVRHPFPLPVDLGARVLAWLSDRRLWATAARVFDSPWGPLTANNVHQLLYRYRHPKPPKRRRPRL
jgi:site-specific recombinase XerD